MWSHRQWIAFCFVAALSTCGASGVAGIDASRCLQTRVQVADELSAVFSRTIAFRVDGFDPFVRRVSGTGTYRVQGVSDGAITTASSFLYDGNPLSEGETVIKDGGRTVCWKGSCSASTDASGISINPLFWGNPKGVLHVGQTWEVGLTIPWELGPVGKQHIRVLAVDAANDTITLERTGEGTGDMADEIKKLTLTKDKTTTPVEVSAGRASWRGITTFRRGITVSDELLVERPVVVTKADSSTATGAERQYILLNSARLPTSLRGGVKAGLEAGGANWRKLDTVAYKGKQDDIFFVDQAHGWYGNGEGKLYKTSDGGLTWSKQWEQPGTFIRALGFVSEKVGLLGNVGTDYFPGVTDDTPLYRTDDGGNTWKPVTFSGARPKGICAIDVLHTAFINHGSLGDKVTVRAGGRVGGPAYLMTSRDGGTTWSSEDLSGHTAMILDIKFINERVGFIAGASDVDVEKAHALILRTDDGGRSWQKAYEGSRTWELTWKISFPTRDTGYVTIQSYDEASSNTARFVAKTVDGGRHWTEMLVDHDRGLQEFGIAFVDARHGWLGARKHGYETVDGGRSWTAAEMGAAVNKIRIVPGTSGTTLYAIGSSIYKTTLPPTK